MNSKNISFEHLLFIIIMNKWLIMLFNEFGHLKLTVRRMSYQDPIEMLGLMNDKLVLTLIH